MGVRNRARKFLLQARYASDMNGDGLAENLDRLGLSMRFDPPERLWIRELAAGIDRDRAGLDAVLEGALRNWSLSRLHLLARLILEQGLAEVRYAGTPVPVAIDEAIELSREFLDDEAAAFINGVLDKACRSGGGS